MESEIAQAASTMPFIVINGICFAIAGATVAIIGARQRFVSAAGSSPKSRRPALTPFKPAAASAYE